MTAWPDFPPLQLEVTSLDTILATAKQQDGLEGASPQPQPIHPTTRYSGWIAAALPRGHLSSNGFFVFVVVLGFELNSGPHACQGVTLPLEPPHQSFKVFFEGTVPHQEHS
jgi:hypothetical protein